MDASGLKSHIQTNTIPSLLIFTGPEWAVQNIFIEQISKVKGLETKRVNGIADVIGKLKSRSFIDKQYIYIARDDTEYMQNEKLQTLVDTNIGSNMFILLLTTVDKRLKFYKAYKDSIVEFEPLKPAVLKKYIQKQITLSDKECDKLMEVCEYDYGRCLLEIDKIKQFREYTHNIIGFQPLDCIEINNGKIYGVSYDKIFETLLNDGTIYTPPKDAIFDFVDSILDRSIKCFDLYEQCKAVGEATLVMISVLYNNAKAVLQVQSCSNSDVSKTTGLTGWQIVNAKKHLNKYRNGELVDIMRRCIECEQGIKTGKIEEQFAVEYILVNVL